MTLKEILLIYKKVSNFNNKNEEVLEYYIAELLSKGMKDSDILFAKENFNIDKPEDKLRAFKSNMQTYGEGFEKTRKIFWYIHHIKTATGYIFYRYYD